MLLAVLTSTHIRYIRILSVGSMWLFGALVAAMWLRSGMGVRGLAATAADIGPYFTQLPRFVLPMSDYHAFYLFWWFSWSIMIGQFVARFVGAMRTWQLAAALLVIPSIPIAAWFSVLYFYFRHQVAVPPLLTAAMVVVGVVFVVNSLDSLIRLVLGQPQPDGRRLGAPAYVASHWLLMCSLVLAFQFTPLRIEWIGLVGDRPLRGHLRAALPQAADVDAGPEARAGRAEAHCCRHRRRRRPAAALPRL